MTSKVNNIAEELRHMADMMADLRKAGHGPIFSEGYRYQTQEDLLLAEGHVFENRDPLTEDEHATLKGYLRSMRRCWKAGECYKNAFALADWRGPLLYVEGMATNGVMPISHAWAVLNGKVVDLTWIHSNFYKGGTHDEQVKKHNRMRSPEKLIARSESLRSDLRIQYIGIIIPLDAIYPRMLVTKTYLSMLQDWNSAEPLMKTGIPEEWKEQR